MLAFICVAASGLIRANGYCFRVLRDAKLSVRGFYLDWAEPTAKLVRALIVVAAVIVAFPFLPGSGEIIEKTLQVTRVRATEGRNRRHTEWNGARRVNCTAKAPSRSHFPSIGHGADWRQVRALLISAALAPEDVLRDPLPFVLQTALNDFYVSYELNACHSRAYEHAKHLLGTGIRTFRTDSTKLEPKSIQLTTHPCGMGTTRQFQCYLPDNYRRQAFKIA